MERERPKVVLVAPEIPGNTGTIGRTCVALDLELVLIKPYGFELTDKTVRRAGLDYWKHVRLSEYETWQAFLDDRTPVPSDMFFFEEFGDRTFYEPQYPDGAWLIFGRETKGLPKELIEGVPDQVLRIPQTSKHIRSLNLANAVSAAVYQAMRGHFMSGS